jgi:hypothetical protein
MNKTVAYQKSGRLDWETNKFKLEAVVTKNGAIAPQAVQLTTDACFSTPMLSMGRKRVTGVKMLSEISRGAPKANRAIIENIIKLYEQNEIKHIITAETIVERLVNRTAQKRYTDKTDNMYNKLTMNAEGRKASDIANGVRKADRETLETKNVMVTMILYREKEDDKKEKQREKGKQLGNTATSVETPVNIDFPKGTTVADAKEEKEELRKTGNQFASRLRYAGNLKQFYIGSFELKIDDTDVKWLKRNRRQDADQKGRGYRRRFQGNLQVYEQTQRGFCTPHGYNRRLLPSSALPYESRSRKQPRKHRLHIQKSQKQGHRKTGCLLPLHDHRARHGSDHF